MGYMGSSVVVGLTTVGVLEGETGPWPLGCQALPHAKSASMLVGRAESLGIAWGWGGGESSAGAGPLVGGAWSPHSWLLNLGHPRTGADWLVG